MTEDDKSELLNYINLTANMIDHFKKEIDESIIFLESNEEILDSLMTQIKLHMLINDLHKVIHIYIDVADQEGYEVIWEGHKAIKLEKREKGKDQEQ